MRRFRDAAPLAEIILNLFPELRETRCRRESSAILPVAEQLNQPVFNVRITLNSLSRIVGVDFPCPLSVRTLSGVVSSTRSGSAACPAYTDPRQHPQRIRSSVRTRESDFVNSKQRCSFSLTSRLGLQSQRPAAAQGIGVVPREQVRKRASVEYGRRPTEFPPGILAASRPNDQTTD